ncbi:hypothetical protein AB0L05_41325 [Nonomuraea pusilla]|uniref:hypothetical protein n=1 Tax=Nonomuraea pusilla TaxID=46177 RepID=UPI00332811C1
MRDELRSLPGDLAELVGNHLVAAERALEEDDPERAHEHTKVARRFAARIGIVREAAGIVAYRAGHFSEALSDLRAARRMTGSDAYLPIMADCERGLGRPERAIDLVRSPEAERLDRAGRIELTIVESGARRDLGQHDAAVITLQRLPELRDPQPKPWSARLAFAYADALADAGHQEAATDWFGRAMAFDEDGETDAAERYAELTGAVIEDIEEEFDDDLDDDAAGDLRDGEPEATSLSEGTAESEKVVDDEAELAEASDELDETDDFEDLDESDDLDEPEDLDESDDPDESDGSDGSDDESGVDDEDELDDESDEDGESDLRDESGTEDAPSSSGEAAKAAPAAAREASGEQPRVAEPTEAPGITPAFIEPHFADELDETSRKDAKND